MNSLKIKILGLITIIVVFIVGVSAVINFNVQEEMITSLAKRNSKLLLETVKNSIANAMRSGDKEEVDKIFSQIRSQEGIQTVRIFDETGKILNSADNGEIGRMLDPARHANFDKQTLHYIHEHSGERLLTTMSPIYNKPECHRCHPASREVLGILQINHSLNYLESFKNEGKKHAAISTVVIILFIMVTISIFLILYVDKPVRQLIRLMHNVEGGNFETRPNITSSTEMELLSGSFNTMVGRLKELMETTISHERELARTQEKLSHHQEIHTINLKLEEKLLEIENLNIALEERIEEIEEANYKIADLAGDLEDKNTTLETAVARLSTLNKVGLAINSTMESEKIFGAIVKTTMETLHSQIGYILLYDPDKKIFTVSTMLGHDETSAQGTVIPAHPATIATWVLKNRQPLLINNIDNMPQFSRFSLLGYERRTMISVPLAVKDEIIGTLSVVNKTDDSVYTENDLEFLATIASQASVAISNVRLYENQQKTYINTIHALVSAIEASDSYTRGHSERVTRYSVALARKLDLPPDRLSIVERASILHDIGKIGINLALLHKEGKLTNEDVDELRQHPNIGMRILEPIEFLHDVRLCIGQHHERYDGTGYPNNVDHSGLLLESRILAIADAYDAMTSDRPYRKARPKETAIRELVENAGTQFDPALVPHFVQLLETCEFDDIEISTPPTLTARELQTGISFFPYGSGMLPFGEPTA